MAAQTNRTFSSMRSSNHRSRRGHKKRHAQCKLSAEQEDIMVSVAEAFSVNNAALSVEQMRQLVERKYGVKVSRQWVCRFVGRHRRQLRKRPCKALANKREGREAFDSVVDFCTELEDFLDHFKFPEHAVFNYDETRIVQKGGKLVLRLIEAANKERVNVRSTRHQLVASLLTFVAAGG